jgi:hypothetical protein
MMEFIVCNKVYMSWEQMHKREDTEPHFFVCGVLINPPLDVEGGTSFANPVKASLLSVYSSEGTWKLSTVL